jgi:hypothetical protein
VSTALCRELIGCVIMVFEIFAGTLVALKALDVITVHGLL